MRHDSFKMFMEKISEKIEITKRIIKNRTESWLN